MHGWFVFSITGRYAHRVHASHLNIYQSSLFSVYRPCSTTRLLLFAHSRVQFAGQWIFNQMELIATRAIIYSVFYWPCTRPLWCWEWARALFCLVYMLWVVVCGWKFERHRVHQPPRQRGWEPLRADNASARDRAAVCEYTWDQKFQLTICNQ